MEINFNKNNNGLVPAIVQDVQTKNVLMLGYMNREAYQKTVETKKVTFFSRTKNRLWTKGEKSGNFLKLIEIKSDCDRDTLLIKVDPIGVVCHTGADTCWNEANVESLGFISKLEDLIEHRKDHCKKDKASYTSSLFGEGINKIAKKVGEEVIEMIIEAKNNDDHLFLGESADLLFHYLILLQAKGYKLKDVINVLKSRSR